jgi:hypothetical protein
MSDRMKIGTVEVAGETLTVYKMEYQSNDRVTILLYDAEDEPYATVSVNLVDQPMGEGEFAIHHDIRSVVAEDLLAGGLFEDTGRKVSYGFVQGQPVWRLKE